MTTIDLLSQLIAIDSPTGFTTAAANFIVATMESFGFTVRRTRKGAVVASMHSAPTIALAAHVDTLGFITTGINSNGTLAFSPLGGPLLPSFEGAYVRIHTSSGAIHTGTVLLNNPSAHSNNKAASTERSPSTMHIRIDAPTRSKDDTLALGIGVGDIIAVDPRFEALPNGYIKSHFLDNKAGCAVLFDVARRLAAAAPHAPVEYFFSTYEEVGHGGATGWSDTVEELLVVDMGVVGDGLDGHETLCSICAKDSGGPYDYDMRQILVSLAKAGSIPHAVDVYPFYSSDGTAAWRGGVDVRVALVGPGVHASHGMERAHVDGIEATVQLCADYIRHRTN